MMLDITNKRAEEDILLATFKSLVALLGFSKVSIIYLLNHYTMYLVQLVSNFVGRWICE